MITTRTFQEEDLEHIHLLIQRTIDSAYTGVYPERAVRFFKNYHSRESVLNRSMNGEILVAERNHRIVATGSLVGDEISGVFVSPDTQGMGVGRLIMYELEDLAKNYEIPAIKLHISLPSRIFYEKLGYKVQEAHLLDVGEGQNLKYWSGEKKLIL